jgi:hypothetical protein
MSDEKSSTHTKGDFEIGHGRPPEETRFQPGKSGNPRGRPKGRASFFSALYKALDRPVSVTTETGMKHSISMQDAIVRGLVDDAGRRKIRATELLCKLIADERNSVATEREQQPERAIGGKNED